MALPSVSGIIADAAILVGDPNMTRVTQDMWLMLYNHTLLRISTELKVIPQQAYFDIVAGQHEYTYPDDLVQMTDLEYNQEPVANPGGWDYMKEKFRDEHRDLTNHRYPQGNVYAYYAKMTSFDLIGEPDISVTQGGLLSYMRRSTKILSADLATATLEIPAALEEFTINGMLPRAQRILRLFDAAATNGALWEEELGRLRYKIEDRSLDRRSALRARGAQRPYAGMV